MSSILSLTLLVLPHLPVAASNAPTAPASDRQVALQIDSKALLEQQVAEAAEETTYFVRTDSTKALSEKHGVRVIEDSSAPAIVVHLSWVNYQESIYGVRIEAVRPGAAPKVVDTFECECADSELTEAVITRLPAALEQLEASPTHETKGDGNGSTKPEVADPSQEQPDDPSRKPLGKLGRAGIGIGVVGVAGLVGGGIVYARGRRLDQPAGELEVRDGRDFKPPGVALMVAGGAALVTGAVLLIVDRSKARRSSSAALVLPSPGGLVVTGRF